nr:hypothetical protein [Tanacetum cinerariifolium]
PLMLKKFESEDQTTSTKSMMTCKVGSVLLMLQGYSELLQLWPRSICLLLRAKVTDISKMDKIEANTDKTEHGIGKSTKKTKAEGVYIFNGPTHGKASQDLESSSEDYK